MIGAKKQICILSFIALSLFIEFSAIAEDYDRFCERLMAGDKNLNYTKAEIDEILSEEPISAAGISAAVKVEMETGQFELGSNITVTGVASFKISSPNAGSEDGGKEYTLVFYINGVHVCVLEGVTIPHRFKYNFAGCANGPYDLAFKLVDKDGFSEVAKLRINVFHQERSE